MKSFLVSLFILLPSLALAEEDKAFEFEIPTEAKACSVFLDRATGHVVCDGKALPKVLCKDEYGTSIISKFMEAGFKFHVVDGSKPGQGPRYIFTRKLNPPPPSYPESSD